MSNKLSGREGAWQRTIRKLSPGWGVNERTPLEEMQVFDDTRPGKRERNRVGRRSLDCQMDGRRVNKASWKASLDCKGFEALGSVRAGPDGRRPQAGPAGPAWPADPAQLLRWGSPDGGSSPFQLSPFLLRLPGWKPRPLPVFKLCERTREHEELSRAQSRSRDPSAPSPPSDAGRYPPKTASKRKKDTDDQGCSPVSPSCDSS